MTFLIVLFRAALFLVVLPLAAYAAAQLLLPHRGFVIPIAGDFDLGVLAAAVVFVLGFLTWAQRPAGERSPPDDTPDMDATDLDSEN